MAFNKELHIFSVPELESLVTKGTSFFHNTPCLTYTKIAKFSGAGVYALYYNGNFSLYQDYKTINVDSCALPIYVGKAVPPGWRTARTVAKEEKQELYSRIHQHRRNIDQVNNLDSKDFALRFMIFEGRAVELIGSVESKLIEIHMPLWNSVIDGFGNHDPGKGRYEQAPSEWDTLHPGRSWAAKLKGQPQNIQEIERKIKAYFARTKPS